MTQIAYSVLDLCNDAAIECGLIAPGESMEGGNVDPQWVFRKLNYLVDVWQAQGFYVFGYQFNVYTLTAGLSPHTIGPNPIPPAIAPVPNFSTGEQPRPTKIVGAATILNPAGTQVDAPIINIRDAEWWKNQQTKQIQTNVPTDLYYNPGNPLGELNFWPVPNSAVQVRLQFWSTISQFDSITDPIGGPGGPGTLPQAYRAALMLTLAESLLPGAQKEAHPVLVAAALAARAAVFQTNVSSPRIGTMDYGMPMAGAKPGTRGDFNWLSGQTGGGPPQ